MNRPQKIDAAANVAVILVAILVGGIAVKQYLLPSAQRLPPQIQIGQSVGIPGVKWSDKPQHLVFALSNSCHFCSESAPFYRRILRYAASRDDLQVLAIFPQSAEAATGYLKDLDLPFREVRQVPFGKIPVSGTPTLLFVDNQGRVRKFWIGKLQPDVENKVLEELGCKESCA